MVEAGAQCQCGCGRIWPAEFQTLEMVCGCAGLPCFAGIVHTIWPTFARRCSSPAIRNVKSRASACFVCRNKRANVARRTLDACTAMARRDVECRLTCQRRWYQHTGSILSSNLSDLFDDLSVCNASSFFCARAISLKSSGVVVFVTANILDRASAASFSFPLMWRMSHVNSLMYDKCLV